MAAKNYVIHPIPLLAHEMPTARMLSHTSYGQFHNLINYIFFIEGTKQNVIVDSGYDPEVCRAYGYQTEAIQTVEEGLKKLGLHTNDIDVIIATHLHIDHICFGRKYPRAKIVVQRRELEFALNPHPMFALTYPPESIRGLDYEVVDGDTRFEDGINLLLTPGHSAGCQSVAIKTSKGMAVITGFCCIQANFEPLPPDSHQWGPPAAKKRTFMIPGMHLSPTDAYDSMVKVIKLADVVIPIHEESFRSKATIP